jgi:hypothetical protein
MKSDLLDLDVVKHHETEKAYLVSLDGERDKAVWVPKEPCEFQAGASVRPGRTYGILTLPERLAIEKGLV